MAGGEEDNNKEGNGIFHEYNNIMSIIFLGHKGYLQKRPENESTRWIGRKIKEN